MKTIYLLIVFNLICIHLFSQTSGYVPFLKPTTPSAFQFLKYDEMPINEYSGLAEISIPIYQIETKKIKVPLSLTYHSSGIRVAEEASWVGLGWDLQIGSIVQVVNDRDDLDPNGTINKILPDYYNYNYPYEFCERTAYPAAWPTNPPSCFTASTGIDQVHPKSSFILFADYTFPLNGSYNNRNPDFFNAAYSGELDLIDSEPDIFKANFLGHSFNFIINFNTGDIVVLDKKGYQVSFVTLANNAKGIKVVAPDGVIFEFNDITESKIKSSTTFLRGSVNTSGEVSLASRIFQISRITDVDGNVITFNWTKTGTIKELPGYNQTYKKMVTGNVSAMECAGVRLNAQEIRGQSNQGDWWGASPLNANSTLVDKGFSYTNAEEIKSYLTSITFPTGSISFNTSTRLDINNDMKLDKIEVKNLNQNSIRTLDFSYSYFIGNSTGMSYDKETTPITINHGKTATELANRLKLDSIKFNGEPAHSFVYNSTQLPLKSSYAVDYWGFYNGKTSNNSLIPNPLKFNRTDIGDNGNDRDAYENYAKAGSLEQIIYPTNGVRYFVYELNTFANPSTPSITAGNGLRVKETGTSDNGNNFKIERYTYDGGKLITPLSLFTDYAITQDNITTRTNADGSITTIDNLVTAQTFHMNSGNFYTSSCIGSGNVIGYDKVTKQLIGTDNSTSGKIINYYYNNYDLIDQPTIRSSFMVLPARVDETKISNGLVYKTEIYKDGISNPIKRINYTYNPFAISPVFYGAKQCFDHFFTLSAKLFTDPNCSLYKWEKQLVGFYPIYSGTCLLSTETVTDSLTPGPPIVKNTRYYYDSNHNNISEKEEDRSDGNRDIQYFYYPYDPYTQSLPSDQYISNLRIANRIDHPIKTENWVSTNANSNTRLVSTISEEYKTFSNKILLSKYTELTNDYLPYKPSGENTTFIDKYDSFGNVVQYHKKNEPNRNLLWGYNTQYPVAEVIGSDSATIRSYISNQSLLDSPTDDNTLRTYLNTLRAGLTNTLVSTYTYKPLVGITSQTDPKGMTTYYNYDNYNRLTQVLDNKSNILKDYTYHYFNQSAPQQSFSATISLDPYTTISQIGGCTFTIRDAGTNAILVYEWKNLSFPYTASLPASSNGYYTVTVVPDPSYPLEVFVNNVMKDVSSTQTWTQVSGSISILVSSNFY